MSSAKGKVLRLLGGVLLREARVVGAREVAPGFRRLELAVEGLTAGPGDKLQILLPSDDVRTYSPLPTSSGVALLGWMHAGGPGARWVSEVEVGATVRCLGAQRSLSPAAERLVVVGDETSVAVAAGLSAAKPGRVQAVFAARDPDALRRAAEALDLAPLHVAPHDDVDAAVEAVVRATAAHPAAVALTGGAPLLTAVRAALRARGVRDVTAKAYWVPGRVGVD